MEKKMTGAARKAFIKKIKTAKPRLKAQRKKDLEECGKELSALFSKFFDFSGGGGVELQVSGGEAIVRVRVMGECDTSASAWYWGGATFSQVDMGGAGGGAFDILAKDGPDTAQLRMMRGITAFLADPMAVASGARCTDEAADIDAMYMDDVEYLGIAEAAAKVGTAE